ncbi:MAG TPA: BNR-4 repeat-containing protein [Pilimelia sp.]|nr:BNR-4 repeat-containing protein [Pilimelia sp.]
MHRIARPLLTGALAVAVVVPAPLLTTPAPAQARPQVQETEVAPSMTVMTAATAVAARTDRRPVAGGLYDRRVNKTFITWGGQFEDNYIQAYDHRTGAWSTPVKVGNGEGDSHNYPTIVQADDGHLLVFRSLHNAELVVVRSARPRSIEGTWTEQVIPEGKGATYPMPFKTANGDIYVFIRETARDLDPTQPPDLRPMKYVRSTDNGRTWRNSEQLTGDKWVIAPIGRPDNMNEIYIGQMRYEPRGHGRPERFHIVYTLAGGGFEGPLHDRYHRNVYYTYFTPRDLHFHAADGRDLGTRIDDPEQEQHLRIAETPLQMPFPRSPDYIQLVGVLPGGRPFVIWMQYDAAGVLHDHVAVFSRRGWRTAEVATGARVRDMEPVDARTWRVYATREGTTSGIGTYLLRDGLEWKDGPVIETPRAVQRIEVIGNYRDPARLLASGASSARDVAIADGDIYVAGFPHRPC